MVVIRMARGGRKGKPCYTIVAADARSPRDGRFLEKLGQYDPSLAPGQSLVGVKQQAMAAWVAKGAKLSDTLRTLLKKNGINIGPTVVEEGGKA